MGKDKVFLHISDETFIERLVRCGKKYFDRILISTDTEEHATEIKYILSGHGIGEPEIVTDLYPEQGPLGAMVSVFEQTELEEFAIIPVDVPNADLELLSRLYDRDYEGLTGKPVRFFRESNGKLDPLVGVYSREVAEMMKESLIQGKNKMIQAVEGQYETVVIEEGFFHNINTQEEYKRLLEK
ncbi:MAG: molybdenum cofactor guanylyltransferase [Lachnospiraceae bacterium]|nr:molybdenum cofactor guanylyltransferase [Lachnospiraceae bacterium]